jgi:hypothetical protein
VSQGLILSGVLLTPHLHGAISQKTAFFIVTAVKSSNLIQVYCCLQLSEVLELVFQSAVMLALHNIYLRSKGLKLLMTTWIREEMMKFIVSAVNVCMGYVQSLFDEDGVVGLEGKK